MKAKLQNSSQRTKELFQLSLRNSSRKNKTSLLSNILSKSLSVIVGKDKVKR